MLDLKSCSMESKILTLREDTENEVARQHYMEMECLFERCESPIEELFLAALCNQLVGAGEVRWMCNDGERYGVNQSVPILAFCQGKVGKYRTDFLFKLMGGEQIVVECDGHDFHERTKEQARADRSRDRWMTSQGMRVYRFTGSEIYADPIMCAMQIMEAIGVL